jgi:hypothetical protein
MGWNYRVMRHSSKDETTGEDEIWVGLHEVYYRDDDVDDLTVNVDETSYTKKPVRIISEDVAGLRWVLERMLEALDKPILDYRDSLEEEVE